MQIRFLKEMYKLWLENLFLNNESPIIDMFIYNGFSYTVTTPANTPGHPENAMNCQRGMTREQK